MYVPNLKKKSKPVLNQSLQSESLILGTKTHIK